MVLTKTKKVWKMKKYAALLIGIFAFAYYTVLSAKEWSWLFVSSDSGDWLICANQWFTPQAYGSPLYILLARLIGFFTDGNVTVIAMTILLSCLPSAITVMLVYLIVHKLTSKVIPAIISSLVLLGAGVFLSQSTILEEYALVIMFLTLAYLFYIDDKRELTALCLGLGIAVHMFVLPIASFWFILEYKHWKLWLKPTTIFVLIGVVFYSLIPVLMWVQNTLSIVGLWTYWTGESGAVVGTLSIFDTPTRLLSLASMLLMSLGLALIPLWFGIKRPYDTKKLVLAMMVLVSLWYHLTSLDPASWTFLNFGIPATIILIGIGLSKLSLKHAYVVATGALLLICVNGVFLNANTLTRENPIATTYYQELMSLSDDSVIVATGAYGFGVLYVMSEVDKNFILLAIEEQAWHALSEGKKVYYAGPPNKVPMFKMLDIPGYIMIHRIERLTLND